MQGPPQKSEQEIQEEEELQLALAISQSEAESKQKEVIALTTSHIVSRKLNRSYFKLKILYQYIYK